MTLRFLNLIIESSQKFEVFAWSCYSALMCILFLVFSCIPMIKALWSVPQVFFNPKNENHILQYFCILFCRTTSMCFKEIYLYAISFSEQRRLFIRVSLLRLHFSGVPQYCPKNLRSKKTVGLPQREQTEIFDPLLAMALFSFSLSVVHIINVCVLCFTIKSSQLFH